jgi:2-polyprenyl-6-methoxyphenol hydroxylase-like FAD-dependent oxidoreductase
MASSTIVSAADASAPPTALVSGASFAGLATAFWLHRPGYGVTVAEVAPDLRRGGTPVDIGGESLEVLTRMGLLDAVRAKALPPRRHEFKRIDGTIVHAPEPENEDDAQEFEVHRTDLLMMLHDAVEGSVEILFNRTITALEESAETVSATFSDGTSGNFSLVFGCDGNRSRTRQLVFGDGEFSHFLGGYLYSKILPDAVLLPPQLTEVVSLAGRMIMLNGYEDQTDIVFGFRTEGPIEYDYRDKAQQRQLVHEHFDGLSWKVPDMLAIVDQEGDFYFDRMTQIRMPSWSRGRVALVGDAGYCVSPFAGFGGSIAIIGAGHLADALARHPDDHDAAFRDYETSLRPFVEKVQEHAATIGVQMIFPADEADLADRDVKMVSGEIGPFDSTRT